MIANRSVLFISYNFPPHGGAGVQRSTKFIKYLPEFGWQPIVITAATDANPVQDPSLFNDVPKGIPIHRVRGFSPLRFQEKAARYGLRKLAVFLTLLLQLPDAMRFWTYKARPTVAEIIERESPDVIYTTSGPNSAHLLGLWAKKNFNIPWFADFRDPWSSNQFRLYFPSYRTLNRFIERQVLAVADRVACVSKPCLRDLQSNLGAQAEKFIVLTNGYDEDDFDVSSNPAETGPFTMTHLGSFSRLRRPDQFIQAVELLTQSQQIPPSDLRFRFIGKNARGNVPDHRPFEVFDYIPHQNLGKYRAETDAFLLILDTSSRNIGTYSGKLFEYIASDRPILGIVPPGGVAEALIQETQTGITVDGEPIAIANAIKALYDEWRHGNQGWHPNWGIIRQYTRRNLTARLAAEFESLSNAGAS